MINIGAGQFTSAFLILLDWWLWDTGDSILDDLSQETPSGIAAMRPLQPGERLNVIAKEIPGQERKAEKVLQGCYKVF